MKWTFNKCERLRQDISLLANDALAQTETVEARKHLEGCAKCRRYFEEMQAVTAQVTGLGKDSNSIEPSSAARNRWRRAIEAAGKPPQESENDALPGFRGWWLEVVWPSRRIWAGLAVVWLVVLAGQQSMHDRPRFIMTQSPVSQMEMATAMKDRQRVLAELLGDRVGAREAVRQNLFQSKPRTQRPAIFTA